MFSRSRSTSKSRKSRDEPDTRPADATSPFACLDQSANENEGDLAPTSPNPAPPEAAESAGAHGPEDDEVSLDEHPLGRTVLRLVREALQGMSHRQQPVDMDDAQSVLTLRVGLQVQTSRLSGGADLFVHVAPV